MSKKQYNSSTLHATFLFCHSAALFTFEKISVLTFILTYICMIYMIDVNICLSPTVIQKYLWFNIHMDLYLPITFWYIIYIQKQYLCWIFVSLKMFTPNLQYSYQTGLEWLKEGVKSIFLNDSRSFWSTHVQEDNKPALENHSFCRQWYNLLCDIYHQCTFALSRKDF